MIWFVQTPLQDFIWLSLFLFFFLQIRKLSTYQGLVLLYPPGTYINHRTHKGVMCKFTDLFNKPLPVMPGTRLLLGSSLTWMPKVTMPNYTP